MDGRAWWATVHGVAKSRTGLSDFASLHFSVLGVFTNERLKAKGEEGGRG